MKKPSRFRTSIRAALTSAAILLPTLVITGTSPITASASTTRMISSSGTTSFAPSSSAQEVGIAKGEIRPQTTDGAATLIDVPTVSDSGAGAAGTGVSGAATGNAHLAKTFQGLYHRQQRRANNTNQFSVEPPDQGLCVGNGLVLETVNDVMRVYHMDGTPASDVKDLNSFYKYAPAIVRFDSTGAFNPVFGPFVTDPTCYFDSATQRWFHTVLTIDTNPKNGHFLGPNHIDIAVSQTANPTGTWNIYRVQVQDDGRNGTPDHHCSASGTTAPIGHGPCFGDFPHIGADANGFYVTTNEYSFFGPEFHGAQVYGFSKRALEAGSDLPMIQFDTHLMDKGNSGFALAPATSPGGSDAEEHNGTEFLLSSNAADEAHGNGIAVSSRTSNQVLVWRLDNTDSLNEDDARVRLTHRNVTVGRYAAPPPSDQKTGNTPLAACLNDSACATFLNGEPDIFAPEVEYKLDSSDTRMHQTTLAAGRLWSALDTGLNGKAGIEYFIIDVNGNHPSLHRSGYLGLAGQNLIYPAIGVTAGGEGVMGFTIAGPDFYPSAGFAGIDASGVGAVQTAQIGDGPADGFSGYKYYGNPAGTTRPRWGDYGASAVDGNTVWIANESIHQNCDLATYEGSPTSGFGSCNGTRTALANWSTQISRITIASAGDDNGGGNN